MANINVNGLPDLLLHEVCALGDIVKLEELGNFVKNRKLNVNFVDDECGNRVALHWAASKGRKIIGHSNLFYKQKQGV